MSEFKERILNEYLMRLIALQASELKEALSKGYINFIYKDKIRYSQSKEYWNLVHKETSRNRNYGLKNQLEKMDMWVPNGCKYSNNDPHITYSSNQYGNRRHENSCVWENTSDTSPIGYEITTSKEEYFRMIIDEFIQQTQNNPLGTFVCCYLNGNIDIFKSEKYLYFIDDCIKHQIVKFEPFLDCFKKYCSQQGTHVLSKETIKISDSYELTPTEIKKSIFSFMSKDLEQVQEDCAVEVSINDSKKHSTFFVMTRVFPNLKGIINYKVNDCFTINNLPYKYTILRIYT